MTHQGDVGLGGRVAKGSEHALEAAARCQRVGRHGGGPGKSPRENLRGLAGANQGAREDRIQSNSQRREPSDDLLELCPALPCQLPFLVPSPGAMLLGLTVAYDIDLHAVQSTGGVHPAPSRLGARATPLPRSQPEAGTQNPLHPVAPFARLRATATVPLMIGGIRIGRILGIPIYLHPTWFLVFLLVTWGLVVRLQSGHSDWSGETRLLAASLTSALFFVSILLHELGHSVLALRHRVPVRSITLFIFGGVALMEREPESSGGELQIAIAGPIVSALLALGFLGLSRVADPNSLLGSLAGWLAFINAGVALFNLLPGYPLDGGRVLRAFVWARSGDRERATRVAANAGQWMAYALIAAGAVQALRGDLGGLWLAFIGWFLHSAATSTIRQALVDASLTRLRARDLMSEDVPRIATDSSIAQFARDLVMRGRRWALVEHDGSAVGLISLTDVRRVPPEAWDTTQVGRIATPIDALLTAPPDTPVRDLLRTMATRKVNQIPIREGSQIVGAVTREALVQAIEMTTALGEGSAPTKTPVLYSSYEQEGRDVRAPGP